jgi:hypothetical protein
MKTLLLTLAVTWIVSAQPVIDVPREGAMLDHSGMLRPVQGIVQSFTVGDALATGVLSAACGRELCVAKTGDSILPGIAAPPGPALISILGTSASLYFPATRQFARLHDGGLEFLDWSVDGEVLALRGDRIVVRRDNGVWIVRPDGSSLSSLPNEVTAVVLLKEVIVFATADALIVQRTESDPLRFELAGVVGFSQLSEHYVQVSTIDSSYALRIDAGREQISVLPEVAP